MDTKTCSTCKKDWPLELYHKNSSRKDGRAPRCKMCTREARVKAKQNRLELPLSTNTTKAILRKYGLTKEEYIKLRFVQTGLCAICRKPRKLVVDHNHVSGKVRGLLCGQCNTGLGMFGDSLRYLRNAVKYLEEPPMGAV